MAVTIVQDDEYVIEQGSTITFNTDHTTLGTVQFALDASVNYGTAKTFVAGINQIQDFKGKFKCPSVGSGGTFLEFQIHPTK